MKMVKNNKKEKLLKISKSFTCLGISQFDNQLAKFWHINFNHFVKDINAKDIEFIEDKGFILNQKDNSSFKVIFNPNIVAPKKITLELTNLTGHLCQNFVIDFLDTNIDTVKITQNACFSSLSDNYIRRKKIDTTYINAQKYSQRNVEYFVRGTLECENNYSKEMTIFYPYLDKRYIRSTIIVGVNEENSARPIFEKYDGQKIQPITSSEFADELKKDKKAKFKVLKKVA